MKSLPASCSNPAAGRITCHAGILAAQNAGGVQPLVVLPATLVAPTAYGSGSIVFTITATEREHNYGAVSNGTTQVTLYDTALVTTTAGDGAGSLRQAIIDSNANCQGDGYASYSVQLFANDDGDPSGYGQGQRPLAVKNIVFRGKHFHYETDGDLTGQLISAMTTRTIYEGFAKPEGAGQGFLTQTSELSRWIEVR